MKRGFLKMISTAVCCLAVACPGFVSGQDLPVINGKKTVATVNDEPITLEELNREISKAHAGRTEMMGAGPGVEKKGGRIDYAAFLERLINARLMLLEARNMGMGELPEITDAVKKYSEETLIRLLLETHVKDVTADEDEVRRLYSESVREWKLKLIHCRKEADAQKIKSLIKTDSDFDAVAASAVAKGIAEGGQEEYLKHKDLTAPVAKLVSTMEAGAVSPVVSAGKESFIIFKLLGFRLPEQEDTEAMRRARVQSLNRKRVESAKAYTEELMQRHVSINETLVESLDFESEAAGFEKMLKDERVVAEVSGAEPVTVGDLAAALKNKFFHGIESAVQRKKINPAKHRTLDVLLHERVYLKEAFSQGIDRTDAYKDNVREYEASLLFGMFVNRVVAPEVKLDAKELEAYYRDNIDEYASPEMLRIKSIVFGRKGAAESALEKLSAGTDFNWLGSHAEGLLPPETKGLLQFNGNLLITSSLPGDLQQAVSGVKAGDFRLYASPEGHFYVLHVYQVVASKPQAFESVKKKIARTVFNEKLGREMDLWAKRLKEYYPVRIYRDDLKK